MDDEERRHERDAAVLDERYGLLVEHRRMLERIDARLGGDAHTTCPVRVRRDAQASAMRFLDRRGRLFRGVLRDLRRRSTAEDAAGGEELDHARARMHLLAHGLADLIRTVCDPAHLETVPARRRDAATRRDDPRTFERAALDRPAQLDDHRTIRAEIADGGDTGTQRGARVAEGLERRQGVALLHLRGEVRIAVEREMAVAVDEPGHHESARCTRDLAPFIWRRPRDLAAVGGPEDLGTVYDDRRVLYHAIHVDKSFELSQCLHRAATPYD